MQDIGFDIIADLNLKSNDTLDWSYKSTSLYCLVAGNVSSDLRIVRETLKHLSNYYQGVFYVPGTLEYESATDIPDRLAQLKGMTSNIKNVAMLNQHVAIIDGIALLGVNGWNGSRLDGDDFDMHSVIARETELEYLGQSISRLQRHLDVKKIVVLTNAVPHPDLYFREKPTYVDDQTPLSNILTFDTEKKVSHWVFGSYDKLVDKNIDGITYANNPAIDKSIYYAKRITLSV
jgi:hypothetical protein